MLERGGWGIVVGVLLAVGGAPRNALGEGGDPGDKVRFGAAASLGAGFYQFGDVGPWLEAGGVARVPLAGALYLNAGLLLAYARNSNDKQLDYDGDGEDDLNTDRRALLALLPRAMLGIRLTRGFALELGGFVGVAHTTLSSTKCGESSQTGLGYGFSAGPALTLGERRQLGLALHGEFSWVPYERCTNGSADSFEAGTSFSPHRHLQDDAQLGVLVRAQYLF